MVPASCRARTMRPGCDPDVGAAVAADLGLVADAAERDADEPPAHRPGDRLAEAGLADSGRPDERDDRAVAASTVAHSAGVRARRDGSWSGFVVPIGPVEASFAAELARGEELDDAVLDVVEAVVVGVEHAAGGVEVELVVAAVAPRQLEHAVEPGADPGVLGRLRCSSARTDRAPWRSAVPARPRVRRSPSRRARNSSDDVVVVLAQLLADRGELLAQQELALLLVHALADVVADRLGDLQLGEMAAAQARIASTRSAGSTARAHGRDRRS